MPEEITTTPDAPVVEGAEAVDTLVDDLRGEGAEGGGEETLIDPRFESVADMVAKFDKTKTIAGKTANNLAKERAKTRRLEEELDAMKEGREPKPAGLEADNDDEHVPYKPEGEIGQSFYDEATFQQLMSAHDDNWESMKDDPTYTGQARSIMKAVMNAVGNVGVEIQQLRREQKMATLGVGQDEVENFLSIPNFSHMRGMPFEQIVDVMVGMKSFAEASQKPSAPAPAQGAGAPRTVRRDPTSLGGGRTARGADSLTPANAIHSALDSGDRAEARKLASNMFFGEMAGRKEY